MPRFIPLRIPPGIFRNGTKYQSKQRWFDANLVRWVEGAMQPWGGWVKVQESGAPPTDINVGEPIRGMIAWRGNNQKPRLAFGTPTKAYSFIEGVLTNITISAVAAAISDDGGVMTDETTDANNAATNDVVLVPASPAVNDAFYLGFHDPFKQVKINVSTVATDGVVTWEYWNGSGWSAFSSVTDGTNSFKTSGTNTVKFTVPSDWATTTVNSQGPFYYIRARVSSAGTSTALGAQAWIESGVVAGQSNQSTSTGNYNQGAYNAGNYGSGDPLQGTVVEAQTWQLDTFGQYLVACAYSDGSLYVWDLHAPPDGILSPMLGAPVSCLGIVVTPERFVVALGAGGDGRMVQWADQESYTVWTPSPSNQAGDFPLTTPGQLMAGRRGRNETLLWTDADLWAMRYIGGSYVYSFHQVGARCGAVSRHSMVVVDGKAIWMSHRGFFMYDGFVRAIPSEVSDYIFNDINRGQSSKIFATTLSELKKVVWFYPSAGSTEIDRYVEYDHGENTWAIGALERTSGIDRGPFTYPLMADSLGAVYDHERGESYLDPEDVALTPYAESGPFELARGDQVMDVLALVPDDKTVGDVQARFYASFYPDDDEVEYGPYTLSEYTTMRLSGRQVRLKVVQVNADWRVGIPRLEVEAGGRR